MAGNARSGRRRLPKPKPTQDLRTALEQLDPEKPAEVRNVLKLMALAVTKGQIDPRTSEPPIAALKAALASKALETKASLMREEREKYEELLREAKRVRRAGQQREVADRQRAPANGAPRTTPEA